MSPPLPLVLSPSGSREFQLAEDLMVLGFSQRSATFGHARAWGDGDGDLLQLQFSGTNPFRTPHPSSRESTSSPEANWRVQGVGLG